MTPTDVVLILKELQSINQGLWSLLVLLLAIFARVMFMR